MPKKKASIPKNLLLFTASIAFTLVFAELGLRGFAQLKKWRTQSQVAVRLTPLVFSPEQQRIEAEKSRDLMSYGDCYEDPTDFWGKNETFAKTAKHPFLAYYPVPNTTGNGYHTNNLGFRYSEDFSAIKPKDEVRIFFTGGSTAWGAGVGQGQLYSTILEKMFQEKYPNRKIRVISAGVGGYYTTNERILIENRISELSPDVIVMLSGWNDTYCGYEGLDCLDQHFWFKGDSKSDDTSKKNEDSAVTARVLSKAEMPNSDDYDFKLQYLIKKVKYTFQRRAEIEKSEAYLKKHIVDKSVIAKILLKNIHLVSDLKKRTGYRFVFYLQPTIHNTKKVLTPREKTVLGDLSYQMLAAYASDLYDIFRHLLPEDAKKEKYTYVDGDLSVVNEQKGVFIDYVHLGDRGNQLMAQQLFPVLENILKSDGLIHRQADRLTSSNTHSPDLSAH